MAEFDWHLPPSDKFSYENTFDKFLSETVSLKQMEQILENSRLKSDEILHACHAINKGQFVYFMHIITSKRRGRNLPIGIPLQIKEEFLQSTSESKAFVRPIDNSRSVGAFLTNQELEQESKRLDSEIESLSNTKHIDLSTNLQELNQLLNYKKTQVTQLKLDMEQEKKSFENCQSGNNQEILELLVELNKEKDELEQIVNNFQQ